MKTALETDLNRLADEAATLMTTFLNPGTDRRTAESCRKLLVEEFAEPVIHKVVKRTMRVDPKPRAGLQTERLERACDAYGEALVATCQALDAWRSGKAQAPERYLSYVAKIAYRACGRALGNDIQFSVQYLLTHQQGLALWHQSDDLLLGGYRHWQEEDRKPITAGALDYLYRDPEGFAAEGLRMRHPDRPLRKSNPLDRLMALLDRADAPIELIALTTAYHALEQAFPPINRTPPLSSARNEEETPAGLETGGDLEADVISSDQRYREQQVFLASVWSRILLLPPAQRGALLLGMPRSFFHNLIQIHIGDTTGFKGAAFKESVEEIARALGKTYEEFGAMWKMLPLNNEEIARELRISKAQVNDRRQSAYRTLAWYLRPYDRGTLNRLWQAILCVAPMRPAVYMLWARDSYGSSLLTLLTRESIVRRTELPGLLKVPPVDMERVFDQLPLSLGRIAHLLAKTPREVAHLYMEAYSALRIQLNEGDLISHTLHEFVQGKHQE